MLLSYYINASTKKKSQNGTICSFIEVADQQTNIIYKQLQRETSSIPKVQSILTMLK
jgi:hypothetical protein